MLKFGTITETDPPKGRVRVEFKDDGIVSDWLPIAYAGTSKKKVTVTPDKGDSVACLMDENCEAGVVVGAIYNSKTQPAGAGQDIVAIEFDSGDRIEFDKAARKFEVKTGNKTFKQDQTGFELGSGSDSLGQCLIDLIDQIMIETHPETGTVTSTPVNAPAYAAIKARLQQFIS